MASTETVIPFTRPTRSLRWCEKCDTKSELSCDCGVGFLTASQRAARAVAADAAAVAAGAESKSDRAIAEETGVSHQTVMRARKATGPSGPVAKRTGRDGKARRNPKPRAPRKTQRDKAIEITQPLADAGLPISAKKLQAEHGISHETFDKAGSWHDGWKARDAELATAIDPAALSLTAQAKLAMAERQMRRRLEAEHAARVHNLDEEVRQRVLTEGKEYLATLNQMREKAERIESTYREFMDRQPKILTKDEFMLLMLCVHADPSISAERRTVATQLLLAKRFALTGVK